MITAVFSEKTAFTPLSKLLKLKFAYKPKYISSPELYCSRDESQ